MTPEEQHNQLTAQHEEFVRLLADHERAIKTYIFANVVDWSIADEIWQETSMRLWLEFGKFERGSNFVGWAIRVAYYEIRTWRTKSRRSKLVFDESFLDAIASEADYFSSTESQDRLTALDQCLKQLDAHKCRIIGQFYDPRKTVSEIAIAVGCSSAAIYKAVQRIRTELRKCIELRLKSEDLV